MAASRVFLLSPAHCGGQRAGYLFNPGADFPLALRFKRGEPVTLGEAFSFLSGLYFRGKLAYATRFAGLDRSWVITTNRGLLAPTEPVTIGDLQAFGEVDIDLRDRRYREPLERDLRRLALLDPPEVVLLGSIATGKYLEPLIAAFGDRLRYPVEFVGKGDMSRGSMLLKATEAGVELAYRGVA
jgi:hypothetical protein